MSSILGYFRNFFHSTDSTKDRKRRRTEAPSEAPPQLPKYRRISNAFPLKYINRTDDDTDYFLHLKQNRRHYNELVLDTMDSQRKPPRRQDDEFSDDDNLASGRYQQNRQAPNVASSSSGYNFQPNRQASTSSGPKSFSFINQRPIRSSNDVPFVSPSSRMPALKLRPNVPQLVPIASSLTQKDFEAQQSNGFTQSNPRRRSILDFQKRNGAYGETSSVKYTNSVLHRDHTQSVTKQYDQLLRSLSSRLPGKSQQYSNFATSRPREHAPVIDLSSDENDENAYAVASAPKYPIARTHYLTRVANKSDVKRPQAYLEISDDESEQFSFSNPPLSSTHRKSQQNASHKSVSPSTSQRMIPDVTPVNSLWEKQQSRSCLKENAIEEITKKFFERRKDDEKNIRESEQSASLCSNERSQHEKLTQRRIEEALTSLKGIVILDEEEVIDEFPPLSAKHLEIVKYAMYGQPRTEVIVNKFNMSITRNDLMTLDGLNWLNDEVINFYMELIKNRAETSEHLPKVHVMNTFFLGKLMQQGHSGVRRWTRKVDIFSFDIIPVPVHVNGVHWCMAIIHFRDKSIKYYDAMGHPNYSVLDALVRYIQEESLDKRKVAFDTSDWTLECVHDCPKQHNGSDCGVFSCQFAEFISRDSKLSFSQQHMPYFRRKMVFEIATGKLMLD